MIMLTEIHKFKQRQGIFVTNVIDVQHKGSKGQQQQQ